MFKPCILIPTHNNPETIARVVEKVREYLGDVVVVDDASNSKSQAAIRDLASQGKCHAVRREQNGGKGAAVKTGFKFAQEMGFSHALQIDADGQHTLDDIPRFLELAKANPSHFIAGSPTFDDSVPKGRLYARQISVFWCNVEAGRGVITDPLCGFRVYPIADAIAVRAKGMRMDFDPEIAVRLVWRGLSVLNIPTRVRYLDESEGGVSHFRVVRDNAKITWMHTRLVCTMLFAYLSFQKLRKFA